MKYLSSFINESIISDKIDRLKDLTLDLEDNNFTVEIFKKYQMYFKILTSPEEPHQAENYTIINNSVYKDPSIYILVYKVINYKLEFNKSDYRYIENFEELLSSYKLLSSCSAGNGFSLYTIKKSHIYSSNL